MPKMKTPFGRQKAFPLYWQRQLMKQQINMRHNQEHMSSRRKRRLNADQVVSPADFKKLKRQLGR